jgi:CheY-like chemotaxis protein
MTSSRVRHGQVQAHGALLALAEHDLAIAMASANTSEILGVPPELVSAVGAPPPFVELEPGELRFIVDRAAATVALLPAVPLHADASEVTGLTLRTIDAPGAGALLAIAVGDGAVVCEHPVARHVPYSARAAAQIVARMAGRRLGMSEGKHTGALAGTRVLIVDDEREQGEILAMVLEAEGATIEIAATASAALSAFRRFHPDALVSDIGLPDKDGCELVRELRALGSHEGGWIPAIAVTGLVGEELAHQSMLAGFQVHIPKPIDPPDLVARLARLVGRTFRRT